MGTKFDWIIFAAFVALVSVQVIQYFEFKEQISRFVSKGPRFTAQDGQALCERIRALEKNPQPCGYAP
jgi:uncharacterized membrane protein